MDKTSVLIVEDEPLIGLEVKNVLKDLGYRVTSIVDSGEKAIEKAEFDKPDIILMDIRLKGKMDGIEATDIISSLFHIPVVFLTAHSEEEYLTRAKKTHPYGYLIKPVQERDLKITIEMALYLSKADKERKSAEDALRESEELHRIILSNISDTVLISTDTGELTYVCPNIGFIFGYNPDEIQQFGNISKLLGHDLFDINELKTKREIQNIEKEITDKSGGKHTLLVNIKKVSIKDGTILYTCHDITERKQFQAELIKEKNFIEMLIQIAPIIILVLDEEGRVVRYNPHMEQLSGYPLAEVQGKDWFSTFLPDRDHENIKAVFKKATSKIQTRGNLNPIIVKDGKEIPIEWWDNALHDNNGNVTGLLAIGVDITERRKAEEQISEQNEFLMTIINSLSHPFLVVNTSDYSIELANHKATNKEHIREGMKCYLVHNHSQPCEADLCPIEIVKKTKKSTIMEHIHYDTDGNRINVEVHAYPIINKDGDVERLIEYHVDITERKQMEMTLLESKEAADAANRAKSEFLANMSHELRTPLNAILGFSQILERQLSDSLTETQMEFISNIKNGGDHLLELVNDILDLSKIEAGKMEMEFKPFDFGQLLERSLSIIRDTAYKKSLHVEVNIQPDLGWLNGDETRIKQVIYNLLSNAVKFTEPGKRIGVDATVEMDSFSIDVWDEGIGISEDYLDKVFAPFEQVKGSKSAKEKGTGLGLAISKKLIESHLGTLSVTSQIGEGSRFNINLAGRISGKKMSIQKKMIPQNEAKTSLIKDIIILVVEDNETNRELLKASLDVYRIDFAVSGEDAIALASENEYDLILMDIQLPGIDGVESMQQIRKNSKNHIPILALTAFAMKGDEEKYQNEGFDDYVSKPFNISLLNEIICKHLSLNSK